ncbi:putative metal-binding motif-containing protein, partial [Hyunsoonleella aestuarii]|uniref:putative metal-binding motif-containing protein n=1 Tax=Hyunsoonleella aestuarii TaxID=912802 RepID=UPI0031D3E49B
MSRILYLLIAILTFQPALSQCDNDTLYDGTAIPGGVDINDGEEHQIAFGIEAGEYVVISGLNTSDHYRFTSNRTNIFNADFITIRDASNTTNVLGSNTSSLEIDPINVSSIEIHINLNAGCGTDTEFHDLTIQNLTNATCNMPGGPGGITYKSDGRIDFYWSGPALSTPTGYDWRIVLAGGDVDTNIIGSGSTTAPTTNVSTGEILSASTSYWIYVRSTCSGGQESGWFKFPPTYITNAVGPPNNDFCEGAINIIQELNKAVVGDATAIPGDLSGGAGTNVDAETCNTKTGNARDDIWYTFIAQTDDIHIYLDPTFDGVLTLYSGNCNALSYIACSDDASTVLADEEIVFSSSNPEFTIGETYYVRVYFLGTTTPVTPTFDLKLWSDVAVDDDDMDGYADNPNVDCNDGNSAINPGATEVVGNDVDEDCDGNYLRYVDGDSDGYGSSSTTSSSNSTPGSGESNTNDDCDDGNPAINPGATEVAGNDVDEDCDGNYLRYVDGDSDGYGSSSTTSSSNSTPGLGESNTNDDCDDVNPAINPGATEVAGNDVDEDCDGNYLRYVDGDSDGYGSSSTTSSSNSTPGLGESNTNDDCDDGNPAINPGATEVAGNDVDEDCDGNYLRYVDGDSDGYGSSSTTSSSNSTPGLGESNTNDDCDDGNPAINPGATEVAGNDVDEDCDGNYLRYVDGDSDGYGSSSTTSS